MSQHEYRLTMEWTGNSGVGTKDYRAYERSYTISTPGKPALWGSSDPAFRGDKQKWNPEELLLASLSSCHMLWYLHLCADHKIIVTHYVDSPTGKMQIEPPGRGAFVEAILNPEIIITDPSRINDAESLHQEAHDKCFIANSVNFPVHVKSVITHHKK